MDAGIVDAPIDCPKCGTINPSRTKKCDCGWDLENPLGRSAKRRADTPLNVLGVMALIAAMCLVLAAFQYGTEHGFTWRLMTSSAAGMCAYLVWQGLRLVRARRP
jgi:hypothetical protein